MKKKEMTKRKTIRICGSTYELIFDPKINGGQFQSMAEDGTAGGIIVVGTKCGDAQQILETLLHEILESILAVDNRRWRDGSNERSDMIFCFNHAYLTEFVPKVLDALISSRVLDMEEKEV